MLIFSNALGSFVFDSNFKVVDKVLFSKKESIENAYLLSKGKELSSEKKLLKKHSKAQKPTDPNIINKILNTFKGEEKRFYDINILNTKRLIKESVSDDQLIIQAVRTIEDLDKVANGLCKRLRDWYSLYLPEASKGIADNEAFVRVILKKSKMVLLKELNIDTTMGKDLEKRDVDSIMDLAKTIQNLYEQRTQKESYIETVMKKVCPNMLEISGPTIGAKLLAQAKGLKHLIMMPSSTVQLLGAEEALFRHIKTGAKPPKYGILLQHKLVSKAKRQNKGKVARAIADKISIAAKVDYFKGEPIGEKLRVWLEKKFSKL